MSADCECMAWVQSAPSLLPVQDRRLRGLPAPHSVHVCIEPTVASAFAPVQSAATNVVAWFPLAPAGFSSSTPGTGAMSKCSRRFVWLGFGELGLSGLSLLV